MSAVRDEIYTVEHSAEELINREIKKFNITDNAIAELSEKYMALTVTDVNDKETYQAVKAARQIVKGYRIDVDKRRKELTADAVALQKGINKEAYRITDLLEPIETHLKNQEQIFDDEKEKIRVEKEQAKQREFDQRLFAITSLSFAFNGFDYKCAYSSVIFNNNILKNLPEESFKKAIDELTPLHEAFKIAEAEKIRLENEAKAEAEKQRMFQEAEAEQRRQDAIAENKRIAEENQKIAAENARLQNELIEQKKIANEAAAKIIEEKNAKMRKDLAEFANAGANAARANESSVERIEKFVVKSPANDVPAKPDTTSFERDKLTIVNYMQAIQASSIKTFHSVKGEQFYQHMKSQLNALFQEFEKDLQNLGA
jgi:hypothetical protein